MIKSESERIALAGALVLGIAVSISGLAGFAVTTTQTENAISESLLLALKSRAELFTINIELHVGRARLIATRPALIAALRRLHSRPDDAAAIKQLQSAAQSFLPFGFDGITFYSPDDNKWTTAGKFAQYPALSVRLSMPYPAYLIWNDGFALTTSMPLLHDGQTVGYVVIEQSMQTLTEAMRTAPELGRTGETAVCELKEDRFYCFPPRVFNIPYSRALPMSQAVAGKTGIVKSRDYRGQNVIAAHGPLGKLGLGIVVKIDAAEFYAPIRAQFQVVLLLLLFMVIGGALLLRFHIRPLTKQIITSEQRLKLALDASRYGTGTWPAGKSI